MKDYYYRLPVVVIGSNLLPLFGVFFLGWNLAVIMIIFWIENVIIGLFNILKMVFAKKGEGKFLRIIFFISHYGLFTFVHGVFIFTIFAHTVFGQPLNPNVDWRGIVFGSGGIFLIYLFTFFTEYIFNQKYKIADVGKLFETPYNRVVMMHITIICGAILIAWTGQSIFTLGILVVMKTGLDLRNYLAIS